MTTASKPAAKRAAAKSDIVSEVKAEIKPRYAGILLHPTSFPGPYGVGDLGPGAYEFIDFLKKADLSIWQCLPLGPTGYGDSPYQAFSSFAGQPLIISPDLLAEDGLLTQEDLTDLPEFDRYSVHYGDAIAYKNILLHRACDHFKALKGTSALKKAFKTFCQEQDYWLTDYALFMALKDANGGAAWTSWEEETRFLTEETKAQKLKELEDGVLYYEFIQFVFLKQWMALKAYANKNGISIVGDIPIFVSPDSADVWANKSLFQLDSKGYPTAVAGVPPDYFSATGQLWGNPLYNWKEHKAQGYAWWILRIKHQLQLTDYLRIDHFRGFEAYWSVPYGDKTAMNGKWIKGPGAALFKAVEKELGKGLPIFAEDLGIITPQVEKLRDTFGFPGMKILQFAFNDLSESAHLPYLHTENSICYTGTHDNNTTMGWYLELPKEELRDKVRRYVNSDGSSIHWDFIRLAFGSVSRYAIFPLQDLFGYGADCRMNTPGVAAGNWAWRYKSELLSDDLAEAVRLTAELYGRNASRNPR